MKSWIKIKDGVLVRYTDGPYNLPTVDGWREVAYPATQWKLDAIGRVIKKSLAELLVEAQTRADGRAEDRQRIGNKIEIVLAAFETGDHIPLRNFLTRVVLKFRDLEKEI